LTAAGIFLTILRVELTALSLLPPVNSADMCDLTTERRSARLHDLRAGLPDGKFLYQKS
jgi:hypothetical protein